METENQVLSSSAPCRVPVTFSALVQRLRRHHAAEGAELYRTRLPYRRVAGAWHLVTRDGDVRAFATDAALVAHAREVGVLAQHEEVQP